MRGGDVGSGLKDKSNGWANGSEGKRRSGLTLSLDEGRRYPAVERRCARVVAKPLRIEL